MRKTIVGLAIAALFSSVAHAFSLDGGDDKGLASAIVIGSGAATTFTGNNSVVVGTNAGGSVDSVAIGNGASASYHFGMGTGGGTAVGNAAKTGEGVAIGNGADSTGFTATAVGVTATASALNGVALGTGANATAIGSVALGAGSQATVANTVSVGYAGGERRIMNVATAVAGTDAVNKAQLDAAIAGAGGADAVARAAATAAQTTADGAATAAGAAGAAAAAAGVTANAAATAAGTAQTGVNNVVNGTTDLSNATVGGVTLATIATAGSTDNVARATANTALTQSQQTQAQLDSFASSTESRFRGIDTRLGEMTREYRAGIAASMAGTHAVTAAMQGNHLGVGVGTFGGQAAVSVGLATQIKSAQVTASLSYASGKTGAGVGFSLPIF